MWRSQYDQSVSTWNPQGRVLQIDYAMEAIKQGSVSIGLKSETHAIVIGLKRSAHEMAGYQEKVFKVDDSIGLSQSGMIVDGRMILKWLRNECQSFKFLYDRPHPVERLIAKLSLKAQAKTMQDGKRAFGVGLLVAGYDEAGPHLFFSCPNAEYFEYMAYAIGAKSQASKTYLEKHYKAFAKSSLNDLILHGLKALRAGEAEIELTFKNVSIGVVGKGENFHIIGEDALKTYLGILNQGVAAPAPGLPAGAEPMEIHKSG